MMMSSGSTVDWKRQRGERHGKDGELERIDSGEDHQSGEENGKMLYIRLNRAASPA